MPNKTLADTEYNQFKHFLEQQSGIVLGDNKQYLVRSRLSPLMAKFNCDTMTQLVKLAMGSSDRQLRVEVIDAMTTNETLWFRDKFPFELMANIILPEYAAVGRPIKIWSAACSSGQEPYSLAMTLLEFQQKRPNSLAGTSIVATDLSPTMLERCRVAEYDPLALARGLTEEHKRQFFEPVANQKSMKVKDNVKRLVTFKPLNLLESYASLGKFDVIFCRNVLIYFAPEAKSKILRQFAAALNPNGVLFLGASESLAGLSDDFDMIRCNPGIYYRKR
ncbi:protein-glutamate O-methyltransferase CheR [Shewanella sp. NIFS-20-20]|uniref:CheR family methyltransferase n=1 Tax=Shewanella sp. NIFS-20-20 TaxID=2853806 RepID=UPI001C45DDCF|nr:protein-glutamate O-methyltransferase [Shewanella sp. NIFS-20-20]MBV7314770.1 protein-glutamate O-methyltransferase [Shewanella sp. NIFS-20-20]